jgi:hypothetical protein
MVMVEKLLLMLQLFVVVNASNFTEDDGSCVNSLLQTFWEENVVPVVGENDFYQLIFGNKKQ